MATQHFKRNFLNLYREGKKYRQFVSSCHLREIKMSGTCSLFPPSGDPWPSCLLPSQGHLPDWPLLASKAGIPSPQAWGQYQSMVC